MIRIPAALSAAVLLGACGAAPPPATPGRIAHPAPVTGTPPHAGALIGQDAAALTRLLGPADRDFREGTGRKLQFQGGGCVLDVYLYPRGSDPARVTHVDARLPDGRDGNAGTCVAALQHRVNRR